MPKSKSPETPNFRTTIEHIAKQKISPVTVFSDFCRMAACAVACQTREEEYLETIAHYTEDETHELCKAFAYLVDEMQSKPFEDVLGPYYTSIASKAAVDSRGEFYTPQPITDLMTRIVGDVEAAIEKGDPVTFYEPACGSGGMVLSFAKPYAPKLEGDPSYVDLVRATCQDISVLSCDMCYVNTTLWGIPAQILWGNTLANEVKKSWKNIHWFRVGEDQRQKNLRMMDEMKVRVRATPSE